MVCFYLLPYSLETSLNASLVQASWARPPGFASTSQPIEKALACRWERPTENDPNHSASEHFDHAYLISDNHGVPTVDVGAFVSTTQWRNAPRSSVQAGPPPFMLQLSIMLTSAALLLVSSE